MLDIWKASAPAIDVIAPDNYVTDYMNYRAVCESYHRPDNPLLIPETGGTGGYPRYMFYAIADFDTLGFSPFGIDRIAGGALPAAAGAGGRIRDGLTTARFKPGDPSGREA